MSDDNVRALPGNISLDLDTLEREDARPPFVVKVEGREITLGDPEDIDWQDLVEIESPAEFIRFCATKEDRDFLLSQKVPGWKFSKLMEAYQQHYGIDEKLADARRRERRGI